MINKYGLLKLPLGRMSIALGLVWIGAQVVMAQDGGSLNVQVAANQQDVAILSQRLGQSRMEIEALKRDNIALSRKLETSLIRQNQLIENYNTFVTTTRAQLDSLRGEIVTGDERLKNDIIKKVTQQLDKVSQSAPVRATVSKKPSKATHTFSEDYPKTGVAYTVERGDTLSVVAKSYGARVADIQNANRIIDPRDLRAGQVIFIPQRNQ